MIKITSLLGLAFFLLASHGQTYVFASEETPGENEVPVVEGFNSQTFGQACTLSWRPVGPHDGVFYDIYRAPLGSSEYELRNEEPIPAAVLDGAVPEDELIFIYRVDGTVQGLLSPPDEETVSYLDGGTELYAVYKYKLEATLPDGSSQEFGPVLSKTGFPAAPPKNAFFGVGPTETTGYIELAVRLAKSTDVSAFITPKSPSGPAKSMTEDLPAGDHVIAWDTELPPGEYEASITLKDYGVVRKKAYSFTVIEEPVENPGAAD
jgi:hypothetical protein